jgi:hypothetical protein|tara:strand:+ start:108 stop:956 length:849 start_codon:yes stop_codon:yes gene_type:complete
MAIAENHLSSLARQGNVSPVTGEKDTELVHVNKREMAALEAMGGSGAINQKTGLKEYTPAFLLAAAPFLPWITAGAAVLGAGTAISSAYKSGREKELQAGSQSGLLGERRKEVLESIGSLEETRRAQEEVAVREFEAAGEDLGTSFTQSMDRLGSIAGGTDLVTSAGVSKAELGATEQLEEKSGDLFAGLGRTYAGIETDYETQLAGLKSELTQIDYQKQLADRQKDQWYLGKNVGKMFRGEGRFKGLGTSLAAGALAYGPVGYAVPVAFGAGKIGEWWRNR